MSRQYRSTQRQYTGNDPQLMEVFDIPAHIWDEARKELKAWASDAQIERRALQLLDEALRADDEMSDDDEAESRLDDVEYWR